MPGKIILTITGGPKMGDRFVFDEHDTLLLGRMDDAHIRILDDIKISRNHFLLEVNPPQARIRDLGSRNGTYINGQKHGGRGENETPEEGARHHYPEVDLHDGDEIKVGRTVIHVHIETEPVVPVLPKPLIVEPVQPQPQPQPHVHAHAQLNDYKKEKRLGAGGMGEVYLVRHKSNGSLAALKLMHSKIAVDESAKRGFMREIAATSALQHRYIVTFLGSGTNDKGFYFLLEFCEGGSVDTLMEKRGGKLSLNEAAPIMLQSLEGLAYIHEHGYVHRDLKPQNILLQGSERHWTAKVADLGLAKSFVQAGFSGMTLTGGYAGTYPFMPREQVTNFKYVKPVSDVWAMSSTFFYMLTGHFPRKQERGQDPIEVILSGEITPIRDYLPGLPSKVAHVLDHALKNSTKERYQNAGEMLSALEQALR